MGWRARRGAAGLPALRTMSARVRRLDSVNELVRSQELPLWARLGDHARDLLPRAVARRELFEYWGHEASLCPVALQPLLRWRMAAAMGGDNVWGHVATMGREQRGFCDDGLAQIRTRGPLGAGEVEGGAVNPTWRLSVRATPMSTPQPVDTGVVGPYSETPPAAGCWFGRGEQTRIACVLPSALPWSVVEYDVPDEAHPLGHGTTVVTVAPTVGNGRSRNCRRVHRRVIITSSPGMNTYEPAPGTATE